MSEDNIKEYFLPIRDLINENFIRDVITFTFIFILINTQGWDNIFLLLFPLITFGFSLFFRILNTNKWRTEFENSLIIYNPLGLEKKHANRLFFSALFQLILLFWIGAESLYHPHLVEGYFLYFNLLLFFLFSFGFFWIFIDLWKYSRIEINSDEKLNRSSLIHKSNHSVNDKNVLSFLSVKNFKIISIINFLGFLVLNIINSLYTFLILINPSLGIPINLPGTGSMGSEPLRISVLFHILLLISPLLTVSSLVLNYRQVNRFNRESLDKIIKTFPPNIQIQIIENLKGLSEKIKEQLKIE
ncbi:MAG: hypothetical protein KGD65_08050 [Candidatus Lokiarchaeota archaeon]|nr:hypothetical protein [Candidatus Lokiarchaeota archaeon]